ncbi:MAG: hypothetical protein WC028_25615 [Candidatus Obscuribacterales bacterium]|jgi:hypothetical protein
MNDKVKRKATRSRTKAPPAKAISRAPQPPYRGNPVRVGPYTVLAGGTRYLESADLDKADVLIPLTGCQELNFGQLYQLTAAEHPSGITAFAPGKTYQVLVGKLPDFGGVPDNWEAFLHQQVIPLLASGSTLMGFCFASQGRTGTWLASLIAILEPDVEDPIAAVRERHCEHAVESVAQAEAIFAIKGMPVPDFYRQSLRR